VERLLLLSDDRVDLATVRQALPLAESTSAPSGGTLSERMDAHEREVIIAELKKHAYKMTDTARSLGLERSHLYKKCQQLGIEHKSS
jgi:DNA-binding NtrC family response regulator